MKNYEDKLIEKHKKSKELYGILNEIKEEKRRNNPM